MTSASGSIVSAVKFRNIEETPATERAICMKGRSVLITAAGPTVQTAKMNTGTRAKKARKKIISPIGTWPASLIAAYMSEKDSVPPTFSAMPQCRPFHRITASRGA